MSQVCKECGHQMDDNVQACPNCGNPVETALTNNSGIGFKIPLVLIVVLCVFAIVKIVINVFAVCQLYSYMGNIPLENIVLIFVFAIILLGAIFSNKNKNACYGLAVGFGILTILSMSDVFRLSQMSYGYVSQAETTEISDQSSQTKEEVSSSKTDESNSSIPETDEKAESANKTQYAFKFVVGQATYKISFDKEEKTAQLYVEDALAPEGITLYGICEHDGLYREGQIEVHGFDGSKDFNIVKNGERLDWSLGGAWIDYKNNFIYVTHDAARALNPDYRIPLTPVE